MSKRQGSTASQTPVRIEAQVIRDALESIHHAQPLDQSPLLGLLSVSLYEAPREAGPELRAMLALQGLLHQLITEQLQLLQNAQGESVPSYERSRNDFLDELRQALATGADVLAIWGLLYLRYVRSEFNLNWEQMAGSLHLSERQLRRYMQRGYFRLALALALHEARQRSRHHALALRIRLPAARFSRLLGREAELDQLLGLLRAEQASAALVTGPAGIGKSSLAQAAAAAAIDANLIDDLAWLNLRPGDGPLQVLESLGRALDLNLDGLETGQWRLALIRALADRCSLLVLSGVSLDSWRLPELLDTVLPLIGRGLLLILCQDRPPIPDLPLSLFPLDGLALPAFEAMLQDYLVQQNMQRSAIDPNLLPSIHGMSAGNPLAGKLLLAEALRFPPGRQIEGLAQTPLLLELQFHAGWERLAEAEMQVALALGTLELGEALSEATLRQLLGLDIEQVRSGLRGLEAFGWAQGDARNGWRLEPAFVQMLSRVAPGSPHASRYIELLQQRAQDQPELAITAVRSVAQSADAGQLNSLIALVHRSAAWARWYSALEQITLSESPASPEIQATLLMEFGTAARWLGETQVALEKLSQAITLLGEVGLFEQQIRALIELALAQESAGQLVEALESYRYAATSALRLDLPGPRQIALNGLASVLLTTGQPQTAQEILRELLDGEFEALDGRTLSTAGMVFLALGELDKALSFQREAIEVFEAQGDWARLARSFLRLGIILQTRQEHLEALEALRSALRLMRGLGDLTGQSRALSVLGTLYANQQDISEAMQFWREALVLQDALGDRLGIAYTCYNYADLLWQQGRQEESREQMRRAAEMAGELKAYSLQAHIEAHPVFGPTSL